MSVSFEGDPLPGGDLADIEGQVTSNLIYIVPLEYGHSKQAPIGMVGAFESEYLALLAGEIEHVLGLGTSDLNAALVAAVSSATLGVMRAIADRTPVAEVNGGTAKASWQAILPNGTTTPVGMAITPERGKAIASHMTMRLDVRGATSRSLKHMAGITDYKAKQASALEARQRSRAAVKRLTAATRKRGG